MASNATLLQMPRTRSETAEFVIASLNALGIEPHPQSRLMRMRRVLLDAAGFIPPDNPDFETALEADRDMQLLEYVFEQDHAKSRHAGFKRLLSYANLPMILFSHRTTENSRRVAILNLNSSSRRSARPRGSSPSSIPIHQT